MPPFWVWNTRLTKEELERQIEIFKEMGIGGFHMHSRSGMATPYLSDEFMDLVKFCTEKAKKEKMLCWLYDEDCWPSGAAEGNKKISVENDGSKTTITVDLTGSDGQSLLVTLKKES